MDHTTIKTMRSAKPTQPKLRFDSRWLLFAIALIVAGMFIALGVGRAHGEDGLQPVAYLPLMQANLLKYEVTVVPISAMTATPPTATPELAPPPMVTPEVQ